MFVAHYFFGVNYAYIEPRRCPAGVTCPGSISMALNHNAENKRFIEMASGLLAVASLFLLCVYSILIRTVLKRIDKFSSRKISLKK